MCYGEGQRSSRATNYLIRSISPADNSWSALNICSSVGLVNRGLLSSTIMSLTTNVPTVLFEDQVGGHGGVLATEDGELLIKPALPRELEFYQKLQTDKKLSTLLPHVPTFLGTLRLEGTVDETAAQGDGIVIKAAAEKKDKHPSVTFSAHLLTLYPINTIHSFRERLASIFETKYLRYQTWNNLIRWKCFPRKGCSYDRNRTRNNII
jgi:hypothetical protein